MERSMDELVEAMGRAAHLREQVIRKLDGRTIHIKDSDDDKRLTHFVKIPNPSGTRTYLWPVKAAYSEWTGRAPNGPDDGFYPDEAEQFFKDLGFELVLIQH